jgi:hypothetical protein
MFQAFFTLFPARRSIDARYAGCMIIWIYIQLAFVGYKKDIPSGKPDPATH